MVKRYVARTPPQAVNSSWWGFGLVEGTCEPRWMAKSGHARIVFTPVTSCERVYSHLRSRLARSPRACSSSTFCGQGVENTHTVAVSTAIAPRRPEKILERSALEVVQSAGANGGVLDDDRRFFGGAAQAGRETTMCAVNACERARVAHSEAGTHRLERAQQGRLVQLC